MTLFAKLTFLVYRLRRSRAAPTQDAWADVIKTLHQEQECSPRHTQRAGQQNQQQNLQQNQQQSHQQNHRQDRQQDRQPGIEPNDPRRQHDAYDDRRVPRDPKAPQPSGLHVVRNNHTLKPSQAALALLFELTLDQAVTIIDTLPGTPPTLVSTEIEQRAFLRICSYLKQQNYAQQPAHCLPILTLLARRLAHLHDPAQRGLAMEVVARSLKTLPQIEVVETLAAELASMPPELQQRALDQIEEFLWRTADIAQSHVDILLDLTRAVRIDECRERASAMIAAGLKRLRNEPALCGQIRRNLMLAYCTEEQILQLQA